MSLSPQQRVLRARAAAHAMHSKNDPRETSKAGREAAFARFERQVDPDGTLDPEERRRRARHAQRAHMASIRLRRGTR